MSKSTCSVAGCANAVRSRGWCSKHYRRWQKFGDPSRNNRLVRGTCTVEGCEAPHKGHGLCANHLLRLRKYGSAEDGAGTASRFWEKVEKTGSCWMWKGSLRENGYGKMSINNKNVRAHRYLFELHYGYLPDGDIDHVCGNRACVRPQHLRPVTRKQNLENYTVLNRRNTTGYRGVTRTKCGTFAATVWHHGIRVHVGTFATAEEAGEAARRRRIELYTHNDLDRV